MASETILNVWIGNLGKYNEGELKGGWLELPKSEEEIKDFLADVVGISSEPDEHGVYYEEFAIMDWESPFWDRIGEWDNLMALNEEAERIDDMSEWEQKTMRAAVEVFGDEAHQMDIDELVLYEGVHTDYDLGYYWAVDSGCYSLDDREPLVRYFDYEAFGRDIDLESNGGYSSYGYVEYR